MKRFEIEVNQHGVGKRNIVIEGSTIEEALKALLDKCMKEDDTGIFFELENADVEWCEQQPLFYKVEDCGIILESVKEV